MLKKPQHTSPHQQRYFLPSLREALRACLRQIKPAVISLWGGGSKRCIVCQSSNKHDCLQRIKMCFLNCVAGEMTVCTFVASPPPMSDIWNAKSSAEPFALSPPNPPILPSSARPADKPRLLELSQSFGRNKLIKRIIKSLTQ